MESYYEEIYRLIFNKSHIKSIAICILSIAFIRHSVYNNVKRICMGRLKLWSI